MVDDFSTDRLKKFLLRLGTDVGIRVKKRRRKKTGRMTVAA